jgi:hypothetical protein
MHSVPPIYAIVPYLVSSTSNNITLLYNSYTVSQKPSIFVVALFLNEGFNNIQFQHNKKFIQPITLGHLRKVTVNAGNQLIFCHCNRGPRAKFK